MTRNAERFITPLTLQTLSGTQGLDRRRGTCASDETIKHIELTRGLDAFVVAPATANVLAKFAHGIADDLLSTVLPGRHRAGRSRPRDEHAHVAPSGDPGARPHAAVARRRAIVDPESGWLGRARDRRAAVSPRRRRSWPRRFARRARGRSLEGKKIVVTAGPTREPIDPVRYLSNGSSGKMGYAIARGGRTARSASVAIVSGPVDLPAPFGTRVVRRDDRRPDARRRDGRARRAPTRSSWWPPSPTTRPPAAPQQDQEDRRHRSRSSSRKGPTSSPSWGGRRGGEILVGFAAETGRSARERGEEARREERGFHRRERHLRPGFGHRLGPERRDDPRQGRLVASRFPKRARRRSPMRSSTGSSDRTTR